MKYKITSLILCFTALLVTNAYSQNVGIGTPTPDASAKLDISSTNQGLLVPRVSLASAGVFTLAGGTGTAGMVVYNTNPAMGSGHGVGFYYWDGGAWNKLINASDAWLLDGNASTTAGTNFVGTTDAQDLVFKRNGTEEARITASGIGVGGSTSPTDNTGSGAYLHFGQAANISGTSGLDIIIDGDNNSTNANFMIKKNGDVTELMRVQENGNMSLGGSAPDASSLLDLSSISNKGFRVPQVSLTSTTVATPVASSATGNIVYNTATAGSGATAVTPGHYYWDGSQWVRLDNLESAPMAASAVTLPDPSMIVVAAPQGFSTSPGTPIADNTAFNTNLVVSGVSGTTTNVTCTINLTHTWDSDLYIFLTSPTGQIIELSTNNGGSGDNYTNTVFSDAGATNITAGATPFTGTFRPEGTLTAAIAPTSTTATITTMAGFNGFNPNGTWVLRIGDHATGDVGTLNSFSLSITGSPSSLNWVLIGEVSITYINGTAIVVNSKYSADPSDANGVITALTRTTASAGALGTSSASLSGTILDYSSDSPNNVGNFWVNTNNMARDESGLTSGTMYYYQLWRKGSIESPISSNENYSLIPMRITK